MPCDVSDKDLGFDWICKQLENADGAHTKVGVIGEAALETEKGSEATVVGIALIHEFGATVNHPGGTDYGPTEDGFRFLPKGDKRSSGVTGPHTITIPERSFIRSSIDANEPEIGEYQRRAAYAVYDKKSLPVRKGLAVIGAAASGFIKNWIREGAVMPQDLAPSTLRQRVHPRPGRESKGEPKALLDTGMLVNAISHSEDDASD